MKFIKKSEAEAILGLGQAEVDRLLKSGRLRGKKVKGVTHLSFESVTVVLAELRSTTNYTQAAARSILFDRRTFVGGLLGFGLATATNLSANIVDRRFWLPVEEKLFVRSQQELVSAMLGLDQHDLSVWCGTKSFGTGNYHPDNLDAARALYLAITGGKSKQWQVASEIGEGLQFDLSGNVLIAGGPVGTFEARVAFEFEGPDARHLVRTKSPIIPLRWVGHANIDNDELGKLWMVCYRMEGKKELHYSPSWPLHDLLNPNNPIYVEQGEKGPDENSYHLKNNFLTVTRIPNFLSDRADELIANNADLSEWPYLVVLDGRNGPGTRGAKLLAAPAGKRAMEDVMIKIPALGPAYQLLFELTDVDRMGFYSFKRIEFRDCHRIDLPPSTLARARSYARNRINSPSGLLERKWLNPL